ncbi:unnamed protein product [Chrysodeixis includens]|nr:unnamed protein product [Chrysodeixis includens]
MPKRKSQLSRATSASKARRARLREESASENVRRLSNQRAYASQARSLESSPERSQRLAERRERISRVRARESSRQRSQRLASQILLTSQARSRESSADRSQRLAELREHISQVRAQESSPQRSQRLASQSLLVQNMATDFPTLTDMADLETETIIKEEEEIDTITGDTQLEIKSEINIGETIIQGNVDNPFKNIRLEVKQEFIPINIDSETLDSQNDDTLPKIKYEIDPKSELDCIEKVKEERVGDESLVTYDYPNFDDVTSMDSSDAAALTHVEACLHDCMDYKCEDDGLYEDQKDDYDKMDIKEETDITVTETHLISNKVINTTSTITNPHDGLIESKTTKTLVMEILPIPQTNMTYSKIAGNPEEILPTTNDNDDNYLEYQESFQLNSITGNVLSLEQEAFGLLKATGKKKEVEECHTCPKCPKTFRIKRYMKRHLAVHEGIEKRALGIIKGEITRRENRDKKLKAQRDTKDDSKVGLGQEDKKKKEGYECTCGKVFQRRSRMETCLRSHNLFSDTNTYPCVSCSRHFKDREELALHRKRLHKKKFPCKFCPTDYHTRKELFKHLQVHQKVQLMEYKVISEVVKGKQKLKCFMCSKTYMELSELKSHVMDDHKEPYSCPRCKRTFSKIIDFGNHTKTFHPEVEGQSVLDVLEAFSKLVKAWKCDECGLQFHEADKLAHHQIEKHSPEKSETQFQCTDCRRVFVSQKSLTLHRRIHHIMVSVEEMEPIEKGVMCLECRKICKDMNALISHMRFHSPARKYPCKFCDFRFATPEKRKTHAEVHTGDMKYVCFICEYQCSSENRLKQHKLSPKHKYMRESLLRGRPLKEEAHSSKQEKQEKIKGTLKKKEWAVKKSKRKEVESESDSSSECSEVACDICGDKFPSESEMLEHKQTHPFIEFPNEDKPSRIFFK